MKFGQDTGDGTGAASTAHGDVEVVGADDAVGGRSIAGGGVGGSIAGHEGF